MVILECIGVYLFPNANTGGWVVFSDKIIKIAIIWIKINTSLLYSYKEMPAKDFWSELFFEIYGYAVNHYHELASKCGLPSCSRYWLTVLTPWYTDVQSPALPGGSASLRMCSRVALEGSKMSIKDVNFQERPDSGYVFLIYAKAKIHTSLY